MEDSTRSVALARLRLRRDDDCIVLTTLTVARVLPVMVFVALVGPMIGSRLAFRYLRDGGGPPHSGAGGSAVLSLVLRAVSSLVRRSLGLA